MESETLAKLMEGNRRYVEGLTSQKDLKGKREETKTGQHPLATVICCSDSRVVPEYIFDTNLGEIFTIANAGNIVSDIDIGSAEYGVGHLHTPLLIVMGHEKCGAVTAAYDGHDESKITKIVKKIAPCVNKVKKGGERTSEIEQAVVANVKAVMRKLKKSPIVKKALDEDRVKIIGMKYYFDGRIEVISK